MNMSKTNSCQT